MSSEVPPAPGDAEGTKARNGRKPGRKKPTTTSRTKKGAGASRAASEGAPANGKRDKSVIRYPPYVNAYGSIPKLFEEIRRASVPPKVTLDFLESVLGLKSSSHRALIPLLKKLGFIDAANVPTDSYRRFRDPSQSGGVMATRIREAFADIYRANEYAHSLNKEQLSSKLKTLTGAGADDPYIPSVAATFLELCKLADFETEPPVEAERSEEGDVPITPGDKGVPRVRNHVASPFGFSYTINLNLPATTEIEVFNAIFKSLRENLLDEG